MYTPQQRIERAKVAMIANPLCTYLAGLLMVGDTEVTHEVKTASTNGKDVKFNPDFIAELTDPELRGLIYHEYGGHILYRHLSAFKSLYDEDPQLANWACDYVVNQIIVDTFDPSFIKLPAGGLQDDRFRGMDSKQVFAILRQEKQQKQGKGGQSGDSGEPLDDHDWESANSLTQEEQQQLAKDIDNAIRQGVVASKLMGNGVDRAIEDWLTPKVDWRGALRAFVTTQCVGDDYSTYRKPRRRFLHNDMYLATPVATCVESIVIGVDMSMSISQDVVAAFLAEVAEVCETVRPQCVHLLYWDTSVKGHEMYVGDEVLNLRSATKPVGGGGTTARCVPQYMQDKQLNPTCAIVLTDGYVGDDWGDWACPVLWAITSPIVAGVGTTIRLTL